jgi:hypothetical protein
MSRHTILILALPPEEILKGTFNSWKLQVRKTSEGLIPAAFHPLERY